MKFESNNLIDCVKRGDVNSVVDLIHDGFDVESKDWAGCTALWYSVWYNNLTIFRILIDAGANVNASSNKGRSVLDVAILAKEKKSEFNEDILEILIKRNAISANSKINNDS